MESNQKYSIRIIMLLAALSTSYLFIFVVVYSEFLDFQIYKSVETTLGSIFEQYFLWILPVAINLWIWRTIVRESPKSNANLEKFRNLIVFILVITAFAVGVHGTAQLISDLIPDTSSQVYLLAHLLDEYVGHFLMIPFSFLGVPLSLLELSVSTFRIIKYEKITLSILGVINGLLWGVGNVEGGSMHIISVPLSIIFLTYFFSRCSKKFKMLPPYSRYYLFSIGGMILFTLIWILRFGMFTQPSGLEFMLF